MARPPRAIVRDEPEEASAWSAVVLMASAVAAFGLFALFLVYDHEWTDALIARLPAPGAARRLSYDAVLAGQMRVIDVEAKHLTLADRSTALVVEADVVNDASMAVRGVVLGVDGFAGDERIATGYSACGNKVSERLLKRLSRDEVAALMGLDYSEKLVLEPGERVECQVAIAPMKSAAAEISYRIASVEPAGTPLPHPRPDAE